ncbi:MAG: peptidoglycan-binding protein [Candidatus Omnitrophica bacterium]|nr:peptidoglycan-binding protein [Candidatus Omnitrophota bacterium]
MRGYILVGLTLVLISCLAGCRKKEQSVEKMPEPLTIEQISALGVQAAATLEPIKPLPPPGPYNPQPKEIQMALKNAGFYTWVVDGKIGPMTKKAIEEFQKAKALKVDGIVGPKTWDKLQIYLNKQ